MKLTTTLNKIKSASPCKDGYRKLLTYLGSDFNPDQEINLLTILESNGVKDMLWALRVTNEDSSVTSIRLAVAFAEHVLPIFEKEYPTDDRPRRAIEAVKDNLSGADAYVDVDTRAAAYATRAAAYAADADATYAAAVHVNAGTRAAADAARTTVHAVDAARAAAYAAEAATRAAAYAAYAADYAAADYAAVQKQIILSVLEI